MDIRYKRYLYLHTVATGFQLEIEFVGKIERGTWSEREIHVGIEIESKNATWNWSEIEIEKWKLTP